MSKLQYYLIPIISIFLLQGCELLRTALRDGSEKVVTAAQQTFLPSFAAWAYELENLEHNLIHSILRDLEELVKAILYRGHC